MLMELATYTAVTTAATVAPVYKVRKPLAKIARLPVIGALLALIYGFGMSYVLLHLFSMKSSIAGLANMASSLVFTGWLYAQK